MAQTGEKIFKFTVQVIQKTKKTFDLQQLTFSVLDLS